MFIPNSPLEAWPRGASIATAILIYVLTTGCASTGTTAVTTPLSAGALAGRTLQVRMTSAVADAEETTQELEGLVAGKLRERGLLGRVYTTFSGAGRQIDLTLAATITEFHGVSPLARRTGEFFVGRAVVGAQVILQDARTGEVLGSAAIRGESSGGSVFAGTTDQAIDRAADEIVRFVTGSRR